MKSSKVQIQETRNADELRNKEHLHNYSFFFSIQSSTTTAALPPPVGHNHHLLHSASISGQLQQLKQTVRHDVMVACMWGRSNPTLRCWPCRRLLRRASSEVDSSSSGSSQMTTEPGLRSTGDGGSCKTTKLGKGWEEIMDDDWTMQMSVTVKADLGKCI